LPIICGENVRSAKKTSALKANHFVVTGRVLRRQLNLMTVLTHLQRRRDWKARVDETQSKAANLSAMRQHPSQVVSSLNNGRKCLKSGLYLAVPL
jgi:hypothetical protein